MSALTGTLWCARANRWWRLLAPGGQEIASVIWHDGKEAWMVRAGRRRGTAPSLRAAMELGEKLAEDH